MTNAPRWNAGKPSMIARPNLLALNRGRGFFRADTQSKEPTIWLYDAIVSDDFWGGVSAVNFAKELTAMDAPTIHLRINSPGGDVFAARAMEQIIREHQSNIVVHIDGYAASAASYVALAGNEVIISSGGMIMINRAWTVGVGDSTDIRNTASLLKQMDATLVATYANETGQDPAQIERWMRDETWFDAEQAMRYGFATRVSEDPKGAKDQWNLSAYKHAPKQSGRSADKDALLRRLEIAQL